MNRGGVVEAPAQIGSTSPRGVESRPYGACLRVRQHRELGAVVVLGRARFLRQHAGEGERDCLMVPINQYRARVRASRAAVGRYAAREEFDSLRRRGS